MCFPPALTNPTAEGAGSLRHRTLSGPGTALGPAVLTVVTLVLQVTRKARCSENRLHSGPSVLDLCKFVCADHP